jgi:hypothetical protein
MKFFSFTVLFFLPLLNCQEYGPARDISGIPGIPGKIKSISPVTNINRIKSMRNVLSQTPVKSIQSVISKAPVTNMQEVKSMKKVLEKTSIPDRLAQKFFQNRNRMLTPPAPEVDYAYETGGSDYTEDYDTFADYSSGDYSTNYDTDTTNFGEESSPNLLELRGDILQMNAVLLNKIKEIIDIEETIQMKALDILAKLMESNRGQGSGRVTDPHLRKVLPDIDQWSPYKIFPRKIIPLRDILPIKSISKVNSMQNVKKMTPVLSSTPLTSVNTVTSADMVKQMIELNPSEVDQLRKMLIRDQYLG